MENDDEFYEENSHNVIFVDEKLERNKKDTNFLKENKDTISNNSPEKLNETEAKYLDNFNSNIESIKDKIIELINQEKDNITHEIQNISKLRVKLTEFKQNENKHLKEEKEKWLNTFYKEQNIENDIIDLNIGGTSKISTTRATLLKYPFSALALLFSGNYELAKYENRIFIDRCAEPFINMISYLRTGKFPIFKDKVEEVYFLRELEFWKIPVNSQTSTHDKEEEFDPDWCAHTLQLEGENQIIRKNSK